MTLNQKIDQLLGWLPEVKEDYAGNWVFTHENVTIHVTEQFTIAAITISGNPLPTNAEVVPLLYQKVVDSLYAELLEAEKKALEDAREYIKELWDGTYIDPSDLDSLIRIDVKDFTERMVSILEEKRNKGIWKELPPSFLLDQLGESYLELHGIIFSIESRPMSEQREVEVTNEELDRIIRLATHIGNYSMMISQNIKRIKEQE